MCEFIYLMMAKKAGKDKITGRTLRLVEKQKDVGVHLQKSLKMNGHVDWVTENVCLYLLSNRVQESRGHTGA